MGERLTVDALFKELEEFRAKLGYRFELGRPASYFVDRQWFSTSESQIPNAGSNGVYLYATTDGRILYIGKSERATGDGIGHRSCAHLRSARKDDALMFPGHEWATDSEVPSEIRDLIGRGNFVIWTIPISPNHFVSMAEVFLQTMYFDGCNAHPPLNKKIS